MIFVKIDSENAEAFAPVLPEDYDAAGPAVTIGAADDTGAVLGAISLIHEIDQAEITWLYVAESARKQGVGRALMRELRNMVTEIGFCPVVAQYDGAEDSGLYEFFLSLDDTEFFAETDYSHDRVEIKAGDFYNDEMIKGEAKLSYAAFNFWDADDDLRKAMLDLSADHLQILDEESFRNSCVQSLCKAVESEGKPLAFMLVEKAPNGDLLLSYLHSKDPVALMTILKAAASGVKKNYKQKTISFDLMTPEAEAIAKKLFPEAERRPIYETVM